MSSVLLTWDVCGMVPCQPIVLSHILDLHDRKNIEMEFENGFFKKTNGFFLKD